MNNIIQRHEQEIKKLGFELQNRKLPYLMWIPKLHKQPSKQRFIAVSYDCTTKVVSQTITSCLKLIQAANRLYCKRIQAYTGWNYMWIIQNSQEILVD